MSAKSIGISTTEARSMPRLTPLTTTKTVNAMNAT